jgi:uncharacterized membrane protein
MADSPDDRDERNEEAAREGHPPAPLPRPEGREDEQREEEPVDAEFRLIQERLGRLIQREIRDRIGQEMVVVRQEVRELHIGPLPHPSTLEGYERIVPGSAKMIFDNFDAQSSHRREMEKYALRWGTIRSFVGLAAGFILAIVVFIFSFFLIKDGHDAAGATMATANLAALVGVFVYGSHVVRDERLKRAKIMTGQKEGDDEKEP